MVCSSTRRHLISDSLSLSLCDISSHWVTMLRPISLFHSVQFSCSVVSNSLWPHEPQHARAPCPSPIPGVYTNSCPLSQWCHPTISSSVVPFSSCPQSFQASRSFQMSQLFTWGGQSIGALASVLSIWPKIAFQFLHILVHICAEHAKPGKY